MADLLDNQHCIAEPPRGLAVAVRQALNIAWAAARGQVDRVQNDEYIRIVDLADTQYRQMTEDVRYLRTRLDIEKADNRRLRDVLSDIESFTIDCKPGDYTADVVGHTVRKALTADQEPNR